MHFPLTGISKGIIKLCNDNEKKMRREMILSKRNSFEIFNWKTMKKLQAGKMTKEWNALFMTCQCVKKS